MATATHTTKRGARKRSTTAKRKQKSPRKPRKKKSAPKTKGRVSRYDLPVLPRTDPRIVNQGELVLLFGITRGTMSTWMREGCPTYADQGNQILYNTAEVFEWIRKRERGSRKVDPIDDDRARKAKADADLKELKAAEIRGELVHASEIQSTVFEKFRPIRDAVLSVPDRVAGQVAAEGNPRSVRQIISRELEAALVDLCDA